jgi:hypothetical protein
MASIRKRKWGPNKEFEAWVVDYKDQGGNRAIKTFATKKEAEAWSVTALHEVQQGTHTRASASKTVEEAWTLWLEQSDADGLERSTIRQRRHSSEASRQAIHRRRQALGPLNSVRL